MSKTKVEQILAFIEKHQPVRAKDIGEALLVKRRMESEHTRPYHYYVGWSGYRAYLTQWSYGGDPNKVLIKLTKDGYVLTEHGRAKLAKYRS